MEVDESVIDTLYDYIESEHIVLTLDEIIKMSYHIEKKLNILNHINIEEERFVFLNKFLIALLKDEANKLDIEVNMKPIPELANMDLKSYPGYIYSTASIEEITIVLSLDELKKIIKEAYQTNPPPDEFLIHVFHNAVINSSKLFFSKEIIKNDETDEKFIFINVDTDCVLIDSNTLGLIFYNLYYSKKYKNKVCFMNSETIDNFLNQILTFHNSIQNYVLKGKSSSNLVESMGPLYDWFIDPDLNCNYYVFNLMNIVSKINAQKYEIQFDERKDKENFLISEDLEENLKNCLSSSAQFILIPLQIYYKEFNMGHTNILLVDKSKMTVERFEPHGSTQAEKTLSLNQYILEFFQKFKIKYIEPTECPYPSIQNFIENGEDIPKEYLNKCVTHSYGFLEYRIQKGLNYSEATNQYFKEVKQKGLIYLKGLLENNQNIFAKQQINLDLINSSFGTSLIFDKGNISFIEPCKNQIKDYPILKFKIENKPSKKRKKSQTIKSSK